MVFSMKKNTCSLSETTKESIRQQWPEMNDDDLLNVKTIEEQIGEILEKKYKYKKDHVLKEIEELFGKSNSSSSDQDFYKHQFDECKKHVSTLADEILAHLSQEASNLSGKAQQVEAQVKDKVSSNLFSTIGIMAVVGFVLGSFLSHKK